MLQLGDETFDPDEPEDVACVTQALCELRPLVQLQEPLKIWPEWLGQSEGGAILQSQHAAFGASLQDLEISSQLDVDPHHAGWEPSAHFWSTLSSTPLACASCTYGM